MDQEKFVEYTLLKDFTWSVLFVICSIPLESMLNKYKNKFLVIYLSHKVVRIYIFPQGVEESSHFPAIHQKFPEFSKMAPTKRLFVYVLRFRVVNHTYSKPYVVTLLEI